MPRVENRRRRNRRVAQWSRRLRGTRDENGQADCCSWQCQQKGMKTKEQEMNTQKLLKKVAVSVSAATLAFALGACAHHSATAGQDYGQVRPEGSPTQSASSDQVIGQAPAPTNAQNT